MAGYEQYEEWERQNEERLDAEIEAGRTRSQKSYPTHPMTVSEFDAAYEARPDLLVELQSAPDITRSVVARIEDRKDDQ